MAIIHNTETGKVALTGCNEYIGEELVVTTNDMKAQQIQDDNVIPLNEVKTNKKGLFSDTYIEVDEIDGSISVYEFPVTRVSRITLRFRGATAADEQFISRILADDDAISGDWRLLNKLCIQWGDEDKSTIGYYMSKDMPYESILYLRRKVLPLYFPSFD